MHYINYYDHTKLWKDIHPGWYVTQVALSGDMQSVREQAVRIVEWLSINVDGYLKHCIWKTSNGFFMCKFRHEKDYLWFTLSH